MCLCVCACGTNPAAWTMSGTCEGWPLTSPQIRHVLHAVPQLRLRLSSSAPLLPPLPATPTSGRAVCRDPLPSFHLPPHTHTHSRTDARARRRRPSQASAVLARTSRLRRHHPHRGHVQWHGRLELIAVASHSRTPLCGSFQLLPRLLVITFLSRVLALSPRRLCTRPHTPARVLCDGRQQRCRLFRCGPHRALSRVPHPRRPRRLRGT